MWHVFCVQSNRKRTDKDRGVKIKRYENKGKILCIITLICLGLFMSMSAVSAASVGAYNIYDDGKVVGCTAKCSCGMSSYTYGTAYFVDRCPGCGGNLAFEQGANSGAAYTSPEGLWYCTRCDRDYCAKCGKIHDSSGYWLYSADKPQPKPKIEKQAIQAPQPKVVQANILGNTHHLVLQPEHAKSFGL
jgi:hypothetical protein